MTHDQIVRRLKETDESLLGDLWARADAVRKENVGDEVHLRGLIEISNHCVRRCAYCGIRNDSGVQRYRMSEEEILACARDAKQFDYGTVVMQAGEDYGLSREWIAGVVRKIKTETGLAVTLSLGERSTEDFRAWRDAGADRYLIRFETSDPQLYAKIHPPLPNQDFDRFDKLRELRSLGYEIGSGVMIGIPGQTFDSLARDIETFAEMDLDMIGVGPYIPHPATPLADMPPADSGQVPNTEDMTYKVVALTRILCPKTNIPSTTALATLNKATGRESGLQRGANVVMPNLTPPEYRVHYEIYPAKACIYETAADCQGCIKRRIRSIGRTPGTGRGDSPNYRSNAPSSL
ncbi:MAG: [FeFe] hydrogenase H-cluster radical SAM maturase HydE [Phycisphaerae bacterium]